MKRTKRIASVLLALVMALSLITTAFAAGETYSITIKNDAAGHTYEAYQIFAGDLAIKDGVKTLSNIRWGSGVSAEGQAALGNAEYINGAIIEKMLKQAYDNIQMISLAKPGDKTLVDVLAPAVSAYASVFEKTQDTCAALTACSQAAEEGMQATCDMQAKLGRASRLKEKSIGHQDAGATSCCLILQTFCSTIIALEKASRKETGDAAIC